MRAAASWIVAMPIKTFNVMLKKGFPAGFVGRGVVLEFLGRIITVQDRKENLKKEN